MDQEQIAAEIAAGWNDEPVADTQEVITEEVVEQQETQVDPWEGVPEAVKNQFAELNNKLSAFEKLEQRLRKSEGHVGDLIKKVNASQKAAENAPTKEQIAAAAEDEQKLAALKEEWPEWADALERSEKRITDKLAGSVDVSKIRADLETDFSQKLSTVQAQFEDRLVGFAHKGWKETVKTDDFRNWLAAQPQETKQLAYSERADDAITMLDAFKEAKKPSVTTERKQRLASAAAAPKTDPVSRPKSTANMSAEERRVYDIRAGYDDD